MAQSPDKWIPAFARNALFSDGNAIAQSAVTSVWALVRSAAGRLLYRVSGRSLTGGGSGLDPATPLAAAVKPFRCPLAKASGQDERYLVAATLTSSGSSNRS